MLDVIEALYDLESTRADWLHTIAARCADVFGQRHVGSYALEYDASDVDQVEFSRPAMYEVKSEAAADLLCKDIPAFYNRSPDVVDAVFRHVGFGSADVLPPSAGMTELMQKLARAGVSDILGINGVNLDGRSIHAGVLLPLRLSNVDRDTLARVSSHFAASARLRRRLRGKRKAEEAEAIVDDRGAAGRERRARRSPRPPPRSRGSVVRGAIPTAPSPSGKPSSTAAGPSSTTSRATESTSSSPSATTPRSARSRSSPSASFRSSRSRRSATATR